MARVTALRRALPGRVEVEVEGRPWQLVPDAAVITTGLAVGLELDPPLLRELWAALRREQAKEVAVKALGRRDLSSEQLAERLRAAGVRPARERETLAALAEAGLIDDAGLARRRAEALASRGWGDAAIDARLEEEGIATNERTAALAELGPEEERAARFLKATGRTAGTRRLATLLARRGFGEEAIESVLRGLDE